MMKKTAITLCALFLLGNLSYAGEHKDKFKDEEGKAQFEEMKKERVEFEKKLSELIEKFNNSDETAKNGVKAEIRALLSEKTDKELPKKKKMLADMKVRIDKLEKEIASVEKDKEKYLTEKVDFIVSEEGQAKRNKFKEKMKDDKQDDNAGKKRVKKDKK